MTLSEGAYRTVVRAFATTVWEHFTASAEEPGEEEDREALRAFLGEYETRLGSEPKP